MGGWLLFFSSLPSRPVGNRVKVWRRLSKAGGIQIKGSAWTLPDGAAHREHFQWLAAEVAGMGGEAAFVRVDRVETMPDEEIVALFDRRTTAECRAIGEELERLARAVDIARQAGTAPAARKFAAGLDRIARSVGEARRTDFFSSAALRSLEDRLAQARDAIASLDHRPEANGPKAIPARSAADYRGRRWVTRTGPFVDRMASAWLIRRFIDRGATFGFVAEGAPLPAAPDAVGFDLVGGEFTHVGELCTFEVLLRAFGASDPALERIAGIVHALDVQGDSPRVAEAAGLEAILDGARRGATGDADALERGMAVFEMLYAAQPR